jgi:predicted PP-loop superfamily ATPase
MLSAIINGYAMVSATAYSNGSVSTAKSLKLKAIALKVDPRKYKKGTTRCIE